MSAAAGFWDAGGAKRDAPRAWDPVTTALQFRKSGALPAARYTAVVAAIAADVAAVGLPRLQACAAADTLGVLFEELPSVKAYALPSVRGAPPRAWFGGGPARPAFRPPPRAAELLGRLA